MPKVPGFVETLDKIKKLHITKNGDYANDANPFYNFDTTLFILSQFKKDEDKVYIWPIANKLMRLANLLSGNKEPNHESVQDSLDDIIAYATLLKCDLMRRAGKSKK